MFMVVWCVFELFFLCCFVLIACCVVRVVFVFCVELNDWLCCVVLCCVVVLVCFCCCMCWFVLIR